MASQHQSTASNISLRAQRMERRRPMRRDLLHPSQRSSCAGHHKLQLTHTHTHFFRRAQSHCHSNVPKELLTHGLRCEKVKELRLAEAQTSVHTAHGRGEKQSSSEFDGTRNHKSATNEEIKIHEQHRLENGFRKHFSKIERKLEEALARRDPNEFWKSWSKAAEDGIC